MIEYKVENSSQTITNSEIREMAAQLASIAPTLQKFQSIIGKHESTISSPSIALFRSDLKKMVNEATALTRKISENSQTLVEVSEQTTKYLASIEDHYSEVLKPRTSSSLELTLGDKLPN